MDFNQFKPPQLGNWWKWFWGSVPTEFLLFILLIIWHASHQYKVSIFLCVTKLTKTRKTASWEPEREISLGDTSENKRMLGSPLQHVRKCPQLRTSLYVEIAASSPVLQMHLRDMLSKALLLKVSLRQPGVGKTNSWPSTNQNLWCSCFNKLSRWFPFSLQGNNSFLGPVFWVKTLIETNRRKRWRSSSNRGLTLGSCSEDSPAHPKPHLLKQRLRFRLVIWLAPIYFTQK